MYNYNVSNKYRNLHMFILMSYVYVFLFSALKPAIPGVSSSEKPSNFIWKMNYLFRSTITLYR